MNVPDHNCGQLIEARIIGNTKAAVLWKNWFKYLDIFIPAEAIETQNDSNHTCVVPKQTETDPDADAVISKINESSLDEADVLCWKSIKIEWNESIREENSNSNSETSLEIIRSDVLSNFTKNKKKDCKFQLEQQ